MNEKPQQSAYATITSLTMHTRAVCNFKWRGRPWKEKEGEREESHLEYEMITNCADGYCFMTSNNCT